MSIWESLGNGFVLVMSPHILLFAFLGSFLGTLVGVLPGLGPASGIAILLSVTSKLDPTAAIVMLAAIYYGAMYGGSTTSILLNIPGEVASVITCLDGYQLAKQGKAGIALAMAAIASFVAGTLGLFGLAFFAPLLADVALAFGPPEYCALMVLAFTMIVGLSGGSLLKGAVAAVLGLLIPVIGQDPLVTTPRFTFGSTRLLGGIDLVPVVIGLFGVAEVLHNSEEIGRIIFQKIHRIYPTRQEIRSGLGAMWRSAVTGFFPGLLPGVHPSLVSFIAYDVERRFSSHAERFGTGIFEGVIAPEGANNAATSAGFIPLFSLGLPTTAPLAILLSGMMIYGLQPGPLLFQNNPDFVWAVIASMYVGNVILLVINFPLIRIWTWVMKIPYRYLGPGILVFCFVGAFSIRNSIFDVWTACVMGAFGYFLRKLHYPLAPMILGLILGPIFEQSLRQSLTISGGSFLLVFSRPIAGLFMAAAVLVLTIYALLHFKQKYKLQGIPKEQD